MRLEEFNAMDAPTAGEVVRACAGVDSFVDTIVAGRPYADVAELVAAARAQAATWTDAEVEGALADHPRVGERASGASRDEQAGVDPSDADLQRRLADGNRRYEERFGRIYLVRARGRSAEEMLALLEQRLGNDPDTERAVIQEQLGEIALLRLTALFEEDAA